jgi:hypothetical protein
VAYSPDVSRISTHQAKTLRRGAYGWLCRQKERQWDHLFGCLGPFALNGKHTLALLGLRPRQTRDHRPRNEFIHADIRPRQLLGQLLVQNQGTLLVMVSRLFPPLIKGGQGGFTRKAQHAQRGLLNMH